MIPSSPVCDAVRGLSDYLVGAGSDVESVEIFGASAIEIAKRECCTADQADADPLPIRAELGYEFAEGVNELVAVEEGHVTR